MSGEWVSFPSADAARARSAATRWSQQGYRVAILTDAVRDDLPCDLRLQVEDYPGFFRSQNALAAAILALDSDLRTLCCAADDMRPDPEHVASEIADEFTERFPTGRGVMQPTGDDLDGTDRICGSPWIGREWIRRGYASGPYYSGYRQFFGDEDLLYVAQGTGCFWRRPDLTQYHDHWSRRGKNAKTPYQDANDRYWAADSRLFSSREELGFPR